MKVYSIDEIVKATPFSRSGLYKAISEKRLIVRKDGRKTIILESDWDAYLRSLPVINLDKDSQAA